MAQSLKERNNPNILSLAEEFPGREESYGQVWLSGKYRLAVEHWQ
jgi:hypothetical protein